jgi:hypothetical protein
MAMPWERVEKTYQLAALSLADLFDRRAQLIEMRRCMRSPIQLTQTTMRSCPVRNSLTANRDHWLSRSYAGYFRVRACGATRRIAFSGNSKLVGGVTIPDIASEEQ